VLRYTSRDVFRQNAQYWLEVLSTPAARWGDDASSHVQVHGSASLDAVAGCPIVIAGAHTANPEVAIRALAAWGRPDFIALVEPLGSRALARHMLALRNQGPGTFAEANGAGLRLAMRALRTGGTVGLLVDRDITGNGISVELCGRRVRIARGPWQLAERTGASILPAFAVRLERDRFQVFLHEPYRVHGSAAPERAAQRWAQHFEDHLRTHPGQWTVLEDYWTAHAC
jgi:KDO2-lipid IV(A) lauroyltransferase